MTIKSFFCDLFNCNEGNPCPEPEPCPDPEPCPEPDPEVAREEYWTNRFPHQPVIYRAQDNNPRDVRTFIFGRSYLLEDVINKYNLRGNNDDETMLKCCLVVQDYVEYVGDDVSRGQAEYWQNPEDTVARSAGDCEDGAILMKSLTLCAGVPDWKVKIVAGMVEGGGHAYCTYICDDDTQCVMDWCYSTNRLPVNERLSIMQEEKYKEIWFSFNDQYSFAEVKTDYGPGKVLDK